MAQESWKMDKDETGCQPPEGPILCANNCGFFGSAATMNLCSQCYRDFVLKQTKAVKAVSAIATVQSEQPVDRSERQHLQPEGSVDVAGSSSQPAVGEATLAADSPLQPPRQAPNRCFCCKKRVGLTGFNCRCGNVFCSLHRYSDKHNCQYDYKTAARDAIAKANPLVKADKIDKI